VERPTGGKPVKQPLELPGRWRWRPRVGAAELEQLVSQRPVPVGLDGLVALHGAVLPDQLARPPL
jgi:hypothetical protein